MAGILQQRGSTCKRERENAKIKTKCYRIAPIMRSLGTAKVH